MFSGELRAARAHDADLQIRIQIENAQSGSGRTPTLPFGTSAVKLATPARLTAAVDPAKTRSTSIQFLINLERLITIASADEDEVPPCPTPCGQGCNE